MPLTKSQTRDFRQAATRHGRRKTRLFLCEGVRACREAWLQRPSCVQSVAALSDVNEPEISVILDECDRHDVPIYYCTEAELSRLATAENPQGILFLCRRWDPVPLSVPLPGRFVLVLDRINDPGNLGTMLRTARAVGVSEVWMSHGTSDPFGPKSIRAGMGAQFGLTLRAKKNLPSICGELHKLGIDCVWISDPAGGVSCYADEFELTGNAVVIGSEAHGAEGVPGAPRVHIPMPGGVESLNAAQAATILMFETVRRSHS